MNCVHKKYTCVYESVENVLLSFFVDVQKFSFSFHCTIRGSLLFRDVFFAIDVFGRYHLLVHYIGYISFLSCTINMCSSEFNCLKTKQGSQLSKCDPASQNQSQIARYICGNSQHCMGQNDQSLVPTIIRILS